MTTAIVAGAVANRAGFGGSAWVRMSWAEGLARLGFDVLFVERLAPGAPDGAHAAFADAMAQAGLTGSAALLDGDAVHGMTRAELRDRAAGAGLLVNLSGHLRDRELLDAARVKVFVDLDPGYTQVWAHEGRDVGLAGHDHFFSVGANVGTARCPLPGAGVRWRPVRQPVVLDRWPVAAGGFSRLTTVGSWRGAFGPVAYAGRSYGVKAHEFRRIADVPRRAGVACEVALDIHAADAADRELLRAGGWRVTDPAGVADPRAFARYVAGSGGELSAAQGVYVHARTGWCSDRTVRYLASGRPAVVQDTGLGDTLPVGEGLLTFATAAEAVAGAREVAGDHGRHGRAARALAERWFAHDRALAPVLEAAGVAP
jgi:hypothetical protein